uniref:Uncharacterized protein n=1 Tax=Lotus japonicus TaxID=34305 RepID=I3TAH6_LOTJA|nr:unknown [Lotus japonicus]
MLSPAKSFFQITSPSVPETAWRHPFPKTMIKSSLSALKFFGMCNIDFDVFEP